jgi:chromosome segregation ATPase
MAGIVNKVCYTLLLSTTLGCTGHSALAQSMDKHELNDKQAAKSSNIQEAKKLNGDDSASAEDSTKDSKKDSKDAQKDSSKAADKTPEKGKLTDSKKDSLSTTPTENQKKAAGDTAQVVNQVPGVKVQKDDLVPPSSPPIKGFHPIKKLLRPVENLEGMSIKLEQQIMKLEGPIAGLQPPMINLQHKMDGVRGSIGNMHSQLDGMQAQLQGVRSDIAGMRKDIESLKTPIQHLEGPIANVSKPLEELEVRLNLILIAILVASVGIAIGTPVAAVWLYKNRQKLGVHDSELPKAAQPKNSSEPVFGRR